MDYRFQKWSNMQFKSWKLRVSKHIPKLAINFYTYEGRIDYDRHKLLGRVILNINDPYYAIAYYGKICTPEDKMAAEIMLEIDVCELFKFMSTLTRITAHWSINMWCEPVCVPHFEAAVYTVSFIVTDGV